MKNLSVRSREAKKDGMNGATKNLTFRLGGGAAVRYSSFGGGWRGCSMQAHTDGASALDKFSVAGHSLPVEHDRVSQNLRTGALSSSCRKAARLSGSYRYVQWR